MRLHRNAALAALISSLASQASGPANAQPGHAEPGFSEDSKAALSQQLADSVSRNDTPGVVAVVVGRDGELYEVAAGKLDAAQGKAMPVDAIFPIASMTKPVTSVAIMMLIEKGKLRLDDPVSKYLTGFDNLRVISKFNQNDATYQTRPAKRPMTIRHLMTHTSGIGDGFANPIEYELTRATKKNEWELPLRPMQYLRLNRSACLRNTAASTAS